MNAESRTQSGDIVTLEHIFFSYRTNSGGTRSVLRDVNLSLKPHHRIGLYGPAAARQRFCAALRD